MEPSNLRSQLVLFHNEPGTLLWNTIGVVPNPFCTLGEFVVDLFATPLACMGDRGLLVFELSTDIPGLEAVALGAHWWCSPAMGLEKGMPPEEMRLLTFFEPHDIGMCSQHVVVKDGQANVLLVVDE